MHKELPPTETWSNGDGRHKPEGASLVDAQDGLGLEGNSPVTQLLMDLETTQAHVVTLERENAQLKTELKGATDEISNLKEKKFEE
ncbi:hypothetical protein HAX54_041498 [Datura stramonium]|uniref:Uncharacterized protein n=1 Tax=Datura stramonium TaxID=4076 RepID=A0ABS8VP55_DATST|nr:hypothetical protein [Datura stramonium]